LAPDIYGAKLSGAEKDGAKLSGAEKVGANLSGAKKDGSIFSGAKIFRAKKWVADFQVILPGNRLCADC